MANNSQKPVSTRKPSQRDRKFEIELHNVPIVWDMENGNLSFFGIDSALFWTDPSLVYMLAPLAEEVGIELFRLIVAYSSSFGTKEDYHGMVTTLGDSFEEGFLAWGKAVSAAGWGTFKMPEYHPDKQQATVIVNNSWEIIMQRKLPSEKRWGAPFLQGKLIGIFNHAFGNGCWANDSCHYDSADARAEFKIFPSSKTIKNELKKLRYKRMMASEQALTAKVDQKTTELQKAKKEIELYSRTLEQQVAERTAELVKTNKQLQNEIEIRKEAEANKEMLILDLQKSLNKENDDRLIYSNTPQFSQSAQEPIHTRFAPPRPLFVKTDIPFNLPAINTVCAFTNDDGQFIFRFFKNLGYLLFNFFCSNNILIMNGISPKNPNLFFIF